MSEKQTLADKVRELTKANPGKTAADIAALIGTKRSYVHTIWYMDRKKGRKSTPRRIGRPPKDKPVVQPLSLEMIKKVNENLNDGRVKQLEAKVQELSTVIKYLEGRLYGTSV